MGIPGLYNLIGKPERVSLSKLAVDHYERTGRKFRLAIDASIWLFQVKASQGGSNPELRTLYYRLIRLLRLGIDPVLVFDGERRPIKKRNKEVDRLWESPRARQARALLDLFGFVHHHAPGEAEAECALLQQRGIVDAVFTEDGDTLMFGATMVVRNWSSHEKRGSKSPTHVDVYRAEDIKASSGIDRQGMVLIALMSGADYDTVGIKGCGGVIAREAARAGLGQALHYALVQRSGDLDEWRERLKHELKTNESGFFTRRAPKAASGIEPSFPSHSVAASYLQPLVSSSSELRYVEGKLASARKVDIHGLRVFVGEKLEWNTLAGAKKYIRRLAPAILTAMLLDQQVSLAEPPGLLAVCGSRTHFSSDGIPESRVEIRPIVLVPIDLAAEPLIRPSAEGDQADLDTEEDSDVLDVSKRASDHEHLQASAPTKRRQPSLYDPNVTEKLYVPEAYIRKGAPEQIALWEQVLHKPKPTSPQKPRNKPKKKAKAKGLGDPGMTHRKIESYFTVSKLPSSQSSQPEVHSSSKALSTRDVEDAQSSAAILPASRGSKTFQDTNMIRGSRPALQAGPSYDSNSRIDKRKSTRSTLCRTSSETQPICLSDDELEPLQTKLSATFTSERLTPILSSQPFTSPISSQGLLQLEQSIAQEDAAQTDLAVPQPGIRLRESLPGSWDIQTAEKPTKRGRLLGPLEVVDLT